MYSIEIQRTARHISSSHPLINVNQPRGHMPSGAVFLCPEVRGMQMPVTGCAIRLIRAAIFLRMRRRSAPLLWFFWNFPFISVRGAPFVRRFLFLY